MRLGNQHINLADLVHREHATPSLLHNWEGASHERRADRKHYSYRNDYHPRAKEQPNLPVSSKGE
jgi:hypothetical protein